MEVDRKRPSDSSVPASKRTQIDFDGPVTIEDVDLFQKEAIFRQMSAYRRERDELQAQLAASACGDAELKNELAKLTQQYIEVSRQLERKESVSVRRMLNGKYSHVANDKSHDYDSKQSEEDPNAGAVNSHKSDSSRHSNGVDQKQLLETKTALAAAEAELSKLKKILQDADKMRIEKEKRLSEIEEMMAQMPAMAQISELRHKEVVAETQRLELEIKSLQQQLADMKGGQAEYEASVRDKHAAAVAQLEKRIAAAEADVVRIRGNRDDLLSEVNILKAKDAELRNESSRLKELVDLNSKTDSHAPFKAVETSTDGNTPANDDIADLPTAVDASTIKLLTERLTGLNRQNKALTNEISGLEQGFVKASSKAKSALKATAVAEQKLAVLNTAKVRSDEKYIGAMRLKDQLTMELTKLKQAVSKSAEMIADQKLQEQKLVAQLAKQTKLVAQSELQIQQKQLEIDRIRRNKQDSDEQLKLAKLAQQNLREQISRVESEKYDIEIAKRSAEIRAEKLESQLDTQRALMGLGSSSEIQEQLESLRSIAMCPVCQKNWKDRALTTCGHTLCSDCVQSRLAARMRKCPMCNGHFASNDVLTIHL